MNSTSTRTLPRVLNLKRNHLMEPGIVRAAVENPHSSSRVLGDYLALFPNINWRAMKPRNPASFCSSKF